MSNDSIGKTFLVAISLCVVCAVMVSGSAVSLRPQQEANKILDVKKNLLLAAGLVSGNPTPKEIDEIFTKIETKIIDLETGEEVEGVDAETYSQKTASKDAKLSVQIPASEDIARIKVRGKYGKVYLYKPQGEVEMIILPVHGKGLWSTMWGFIALSNDVNTIKGIGFYEHGETPGLGGEIDNPNWKALWPGKKIYEDNKPAIDVVKGQAPAGSEHQIDGLSGATLTSVGVENLVNYWFGDSGFHKFLNKFREQTGSDDSVSMAQ